MNGLGRLDMSQAAASIQGVTTLKWSNVGAPEHIRHEQPIGDQKEIVDDGGDEVADDQAVTAARMRVRLELSLDGGREGDATLPPQRHERFDRIQRR